jgi:hypothetical protein
LIAFRWAEGQYERLPALAAELVALRATVIVAAGGVLPILAAKSLSSTIQRPRGCGAPEERDEFVAVHSITSPQPGSPVSCVRRAGEKARSHPGWSSRRSSCRRKPICDTLFQLVDFRRRGGCPARRQDGPGATLLSSRLRGPRCVDAISTVRQPGESEYRMVNRWRCLVAAHAALLAQAVILSPATKISCFRPLFLKSTAWFVCSVAGGDARF